MQNFLSFILSLWIYLWLYVVAGGGAAEWTIPLNYIVAYIKRM